MTLRSLLGRLLVVVMLLLSLLSVAASASPSGSTIVADSGSSALVFPSAGSKAHEPVDLTAANFFDLVLDSRQGWMIAFVAPWCGHVSQRITCNHEEDTMQHERLAHWLCLWVLLSLQWFEAKRIISEAWKAISRSLTVYSLILPAVQ